MEYYDVKKDTLIIGGDNITEIDLRRIMDLHLRRDAHQTISLKQIESDVSQFGVAELEGNSIKRFVEKPEAGEEPSKLINTGLYVFSLKIREIFKDMGNRATDIGHDVIPYLVEKGYSVYDHMLTEQWADVVTPGSFLSPSLDILQGKVGQIALSLKYIEKRWIHHSTVERNNCLKEMKMCDYTMIGRHCFFGKGVEIENSYMGHSCLIGEVTKIENSVIMSFAKIGKGVKLNKCILGRFTTVEDGAVVDENLVVKGPGDPSERVPFIGGGGVTISKNSVIGPGKRVAPIEISHRILRTSKFIELGMDRENIDFAEKA
jgi:NDP-sugar pyrophosphorylase family protein